MNLGGEIFTIQMHFSRMVNEFLLSITHYAPTLHGEARTAQCN